VEPTKDPGGADPKLALGAMLSAGMQLAVSVGLGVFFGYRLDARFNTSPWLVLAGSILGISVGLYNFIREASRLQRR